MAEQSITPVPEGRVNTGPAVVLDERAKDPYLTFRQRQAYLEEIDAMKGRVEAERQENAFKAWDDAMKWNPKETWEPFAQQIYDEANKVNDFKYQLMQGGVNARDPRVRSEISRRQNDVEAKGRKALEYKNAYEEAYRTFDSDPKSNEFDSIKSKEALRNMFWDTKTGKARPIDQINIRDMEEGIFNNPYYYNMYNIMRNISEDLPQHTFAYYQKNRTALGEYFDINEFTTKFYEKGADGLPVMNNGVPTLKMSEELMDVLEVTHPKIQRMVEVAKAQGIDRKDIFGLMEVFNETSMKNKPGGLTKYPVRGGEGGGEGDVTYTIEDDAVRNAYSLVLNESAPKMPDGSPNMISALGPRYVPQEIRLQGTAMDDSVLINPRTSIDLNTGSKLPEQVGEQRFTPTRMQLQMYHHGDKRDPKKMLMQPTSRQMEDFLWSSQSFESMEAVMNADDWIGNYRKNKKNNANYIEPRWYVQGILEPAVDDGTGRVGDPKQVMIPYDEVRGEMRAKYKWDLDRVPLKQRHYLDLTWYLMDRFPDKDKEWITNTAKGIKDGSIQL